MSFPTLPGMSEREKSVDSFFGSMEKDEKPTDLPATAPTTIAALIKSQPVLHHRRQTPSERDTSMNSKMLPVITDMNNSVASSSAKPIEVESSVPSKTYDSDFDNDQPDPISIDRRKKSSSLPPVKQPAIASPRRRSVSKLKTSYTLSRSTVLAGARRKEKLLPYIRPKKRGKIVPIRVRPKKVMSEVEQRVLSAHQSQLNQLQSHLAGLRRQLDDEREENKTLRIIKQREDRALKKYEDQEYDVHKVARDYTREIGYVKEIIIEERETKMKLEEQIENCDDELREQVKRIKRYEKLIDDKNLEESPDELRSRLKESTKKLKQVEDKVATKDKYIDSLEKNYQNEIHDELLKQRDLKRELEKQTQSYKDLQLKFEEKTRQVGTMHIYIQRGGRRPSNTSTDLTKSRSLQSLHDTSPRFRGKIIEYDKKRREQEKLDRQLKPKPKPKPLPAITRTASPPKPERRKYVIDIQQHPKITHNKIYLVPPEDEKPVPLNNGHQYLKEKAPVLRLVTPNSIEEEKSNLNDDMAYQSGTIRSPTPPIMQRNENHITQARIHKRPSSPFLSPIDSKFNTLGTREQPAKAHLSKPVELLPPMVAKPQRKRELDDKWLDLFDTDEKEDSIKDDLLSKIIHHEPKQKTHLLTTTPSSTTPSPPLPPPPQRPTMIMFEPSSISTNGQSKKQPTRIPSATNYDFAQATINLHDGKPAKAPSITKPSVGPLDSLFNNKTSKPVGRTHNRDDTFTTTETSIEPFDSLFGPASTTNTLPMNKSSNSRAFPSQNDKLQRPKIVTNTGKSIPNRTFVEDIEEFVA